MRIMKCGYNIKGKLNTNFDFKEKVKTNVNNNNTISKICDKKYAA